MNTTLHAMVPLGENVGFIVAQELDNAKYHWKCPGCTFANSCIEFALLFYRGTCV